jgi:putative acetyltransferase
MIIRKEKPEDVDGIRAVNELAFSQPHEANIVDKLRDACEGLLSLVAVDDERIVGHVLFSPAVIESTEGTVDGMGLAPMAVLLERQRQRIGSRLVEAGIQRLKKDPACAFIIVLGHPRYYPRFGFERASHYGVRSQWKDIPDSAFMVLWLDKPVVPQAGGIARYREEFKET